MTDSTIQIDPENTSTTQNNTTNSYNSAEDSEIGGHFHLPKSKISEMVESFSYSGEDHLPISISRNDIASKNDGGITKNLNNELSNHHGIPFMPVDVEETNVYIMWHIMFFAYTDHL